MIKLRKFVLQCVFMRKYLDINIFHEKTWRKLWEKLVNFQLITRVRVSSNLVGYPSTRLLENCRVIGYSILDLETLEESFMLILSSFSWFFTFLVFFVRAVGCWNFVIELELVKNWAHFFSQELVYGHPRERSQNTYAFGGGGVSDLLRTSVKI